MGNVNFEFLDRTPIENVITCLNYSIDKVIFFGYQEVIDVEKSKTERFLIKYCGVKKVVFLAVSHDDLDSIVRTMSKEIEREIADDNKLYFDLTGGAELVLVAFGKLSEKYATPMHKYNIASDKLIELNTDKTNSISSVLDEQAIKLTIDMYIELQGGIINYNLHKSVKSDSNEDFKNDVANIWQVAKQRWEYWTSFSDFMRNNMVPDSNLEVSASKRIIQRELSLSNTKLKRVEDFEMFIRELANIGVIKNVELNQNNYRFRFKNSMIKDCLWEGGSILELNTYHKQKLISDECMIGVHIDWDGTIYNEPGRDVLNEIDVLSIKGKVVTFISCKTGKMGPQQALHALYELQTVANRFGDKYSKKVLITARPLADVYMERAEEMGIEVIM